MREWQIIKTVLDLQLKLEYKAIVLGFSLFKATKATTVGKVQSNFPTNIARGWNGLHPQQLITDCLARLICKLMQFSD